MSPRTGPFESRATSGNPRRAKNRPNDPAIDEVGVGNHPEPAEAENERVPAVRRGTDQAQAAVISMCSKQFDLGRLQILVRAHIRCGRLNMSVMRASAKCGDGHEPSAAV